ncbi:MAG: hypothetical protein ABI632_07270 [Pseudolysinimonas sp.]
MPTPSYDDVRDIPLPTDLDLVPHLQGLLEGAFRRQVWVMLLDSADKPLPIVVPTDIPEHPDPDDVVGFADFLACLALDFDRATLVVTYERPGPAELVNEDRIWLRLLREACVYAGFPFRGPYLALGNTVRQVPPDDYVGVPWPDDDLNSE